MLQVSATMDQHFVLNYPAIFFVVVVAGFLLYKIMKPRQIESTMDDSWLENGMTNNQ